VIDVLQYIINYNKSGSSAVVFGRCTVTHLFSVVFCVVSAVHNFEFRLVINKTPNNRQPLASRSRSDTVSRFWQDLRISLICDNSQNFWFFRRSFKRFWSVI